MEGENTEYAKLARSDTFELVRRLQSHGIRVLGSTIIGLEEHTPENIDQVIEPRRPSPHRFPPVHALHAAARHAAARRNLTQGHARRERVSAADTHGQSRFNYRHAHLAAGLESELLVRAFERDFAVNGPSIVRMLGTVLAGWKRYKSHPNARIRRRFAMETKGITASWPAIVAAVRRYYLKNPTLSARMSSLLDEIHREFGWTSRLSAALGGPYVRWKIRQEERRLAAGWTYEPPTFYEVNDAVNLEECPSAVRCRYVSPAAVPLPAAETNPAHVRQTQSSPSA